MTRFASTSSMMTLCAIALTALSVVSSVSAHGYLTNPSPRGIQKANTQVDDLKSPNTRGVCRGEPAGQVHSVGHSVTLDFKITAPHIGMCEVYILDENLGNPRKIASKDGCAAPGKEGPWTVDIPSDITGRKVLRWMWNAAHLVTTIEHYEQCVDLNISGGGGGSSAPPTETKKNDGDTPAPASPPNAPAAPSTPASGGSCNDGEFKCNGNKIGQCAHKSFVWTTCPSGTQCRGSGNAIYCGF